MSAQLVDCNTSFMCIPVRSSWALFTDCLKPFQFSLHWVSYTCLFTAFHLLSLLHFPLLHFPLLHFQRPRCNRCKVVLRYSRELRDSGKFVSAVARWHDCRLERIEAQYSVFLEVQNYLYAVGCDSNISCMNWIFLFLKKIIIYFPKHNSYNEYWVTLKRQ